jgi:ParB/RepB/Spo0J family partition protein
VTSGTFHTIPLTSITILREERQRKVISPEHISALAASIHSVGLIHPIVVTRDLILIAGECRTLATRQLGWTHIPVQYADEMPKSALRLIELEENLRRSDITWQEQVLATEEYHLLRKEENPDWRQEDTAKALGVTQALVSTHLSVAKEIDSPQVNGADTLRTAIVRAQEIVRKRDDSLIHTYKPLIHTHSPILTTSFLSWAPTATERFNFIHCDFPYGLSSHTSPDQNRVIKVAYDDSPANFLACLDTLTQHLDNFCAPDAHLLFWFFANHYTLVQTALKNLSGFTFEEYPLIWYKSDNKGIAPDSNRRPRRVYEMAFFGWRGEARINQVRSNVFAAPTERESHPHEKSEAALTHFFSMFVDSHTRLLDPTCGSGSALRAAKSLGATVFGLEIDPTFAENARRSLLTADSRNLRAS